MVWRPADYHSHRVIALPAAGTYSSPTRPGTDAQLGPGAPTAVVTHGLLAGHPDAVALETPLKKKSNAQEGKRVFICLSQNKMNGTKARKLF